MDEANMWELIERVAPGLARIGVRIFLPPERKAIRNQTTTGNNEEGV